MACLGCIPCLVGAKSWLGDFYRKCFWNKERSSDREISDATHKLTWSWRASAADVGIRGLIKAESSGRV